MKRSYAEHVRAHEKSVSLGGAINLFPVPESLTQAFARNVQMAIQAAEDAAYKQGQADAQAEMRRAMGVR